MASNFDSSLLTDRVKFKVFAAQMHLNKLQEIKIDELNVDKLIGECHWNWRLIVFFLKF